MKNRRLGKFWVSRHLMDNDIDAVQMIMCQCVPIDVELKYEKDAFHYLSISKHFDKVDIGSDVPEYIIEFSQFQDETPTFRFIKVDNEYNRKNKSCWV